MRLGTLRPARGARRQAMRKGQGPGSGNGKTAGRGHKGQRSRSGAKRGRRIGFEGGQMPLHRRLPKIGFTNAKFHVAYQVVNVGAIQQKGLTGVVGPPELTRAGLIRKADGRVKVLGEGDLSTCVTLRAHAFSRVAREKVAAAGGSAETIV